MIRLLLILALLLPVQARANVGEYIQWIVDNSSLEYSGQPLPEIRHVTQQELQVIVLGHTAPAREFDGSYDPFTNVIYLEHGTDPDSWDAAPIMVHELAHFLQHLDGVDPREYCPGEYEPQAVKLEIRWIEEHSHEAQPSDLFRALHQRALCNNPHGELL